MHKVTKILGPPGTGKTQKLITMLKEYLDLGIKPREVGFVTFTRRAADTARERVRENFKFTSAELEWFRTLHSFAFQFMGLDKSQVMNWNDYLVICKQLHLTISSVRMTPEEFMNHQQTKGDRLFFLENLARATKKSLSEIIQEHPNEDVALRDLQEISETIKSFKEVQDKIDFTDMIVNFIGSGASPKLKVLMIDEAQDFQPIQWDMVKVMRRFVSDDLVIAGDDDQAIYEWAGADVRQFQTYEGEVQVLSQSFRVPASAHAVARSITNRITRRKQKNYLPTQVQGQVIQTNEFETLDMKQGTWLLLARNIYLLNDFDRFCIQKGYYFESRFGSGVDHSIRPAILSWEAVRAGEQINMGQVKHMYSFMRSKSKIKWGIKDKLDTVADDVIVDILKLEASYGLLPHTIQEPWFLALDRAKPEDVHYYRRILQAGENIKTEPRIHINTIHGVKGGEADNVVIITDMSARTYEHYQANPDAEHRVWYVAVTRAKQRLVIIHPRSRYFYQL